MASSLTSFITRALDGGGSSSTEAERAENDDDDDIKAAKLRRAGIYNFMQVPWNLEPLMLLGYLACLDCFLSYVTFTPLRVISGLISFMRGKWLTRAQSCDLLRSALIFTVSTLLLKVDMSHTYHSVRNQAMLKLYVIFNVLEIFDKLCASFGQDILDSLDSAGGRRRRWRGGLPLDFFIALVYVVGHTMVLFYHSVALNIALNSHSNLLITLLISNNFVELKSNVFKRVERENLFQVACADVVERFQLSIYLTIVGLQFVFVQKVEATRSDYLELAHSFAMIIIAEICIDWIKHAFVIKFNRISPKIYSSYTLLLCSDATRPAQPPPQTMPPPQEQPSRRSGDGGGGSSLLNPRRPAESPKSGAGDETRPRDSPTGEADSSSDSSSSAAVASVRIGVPINPPSILSASSPCLPSSGFLPNQTHQRLPQGPASPRRAGAPGRRARDPSDFSSLPAARMGFVPIPLLCLVIRVVGHDVTPRLYLGHPSGWLLCLLLWVVLCFLKILTSITLLGHACSRCAEAQEEGKDPSAFLNGIERYTLHGKGIM